MLKYNVKHKKAVSPIIAVIVLIGIVVIAGIIVSGWVSTFVSTQKAASPLCSTTTDFEIMDAKYNSNGNVSVKVTNRGNDDIYNFSIQLENSTDIKSVAADSPAATYKVRQGRSVFVKASSSSIVNMSTLNFIRVIAESCPSDYAETRIIEYVS